MRVIIAGSRTINDMHELKEAIRFSGFKIDEVVSGHAAGVDTLGEVWAKENGVPTKLFPINKGDWAVWGPSAGYYRNVEMSKYADAVILVWDGSSAGSAMMRRIARMRGLPLYERVLDGTWF